MRASITLPSCLLLAAFLSACVTDYARVSKPLISARSAETEAYFAGLWSTSRDRCANEGIWFIPVDLAARKHLGPRASPGEVYRYTVRYEGDPSPTTMGRIGMEIGTVGGIELSYKEQLADHWWATPDKLVLDMPTLDRSELRLLVVAFSRVSPDTYEQQTQTYYEFYKGELQREQPEASSKRWVRCSEQDLAARYAANVERSEEARSAANRALFGSDVEKDATQVIMFPPLSADGKRYLLHGVLAKVQNWNGRAYLIFANPNSKLFFVTRSSAQEFEKSLSVGLPYSFIGRHVGFATFIDETVSVFDFVAPLAQP